MPIQEAENRASDEILFVCPTEICGGIRFYRTVELIPKMHKAFLQEAVQLAEESARSGRGGPFGAVIVREGKIIGRGMNSVTSRLDPTAHAEIMAIRDACLRSGSFHLHGAELYSSCLPCPMCYAASYWARLSLIYYGASAEHAAAAGFDDLNLAGELALSAEHRVPPAIRVSVDSAEEPFKLWLECFGRVPY